MEFNKLYNYTMKYLKINIQEIVFQKLFSNNLQIRHIKNITKMYLALIKIFKILA
jgi:hypothetical protein